MMKYFRRLSALLLIPCLIADPALAINLENVFQSANGQRPAAPAEINVAIQALSAAAAFSPRGNAENRRATWRLWDMLGSTGRFLYGTHRTFRIGSTLANAAAGWLTLS